MMHRFLAPARAELEEAIDRYEARRPGLGAKFAAEAQNAIRWTPAARPPPGRWSSPWCPIPARGSRDRWYCRKAARPRARRCAWPPVGALEQRCEARLARHAELRRCLIRACRVGATGDRWPRAWRQASPR